MAWTQTELDALNASIATGALTGSHNGKTVTYRSLADMLRLRDRMQEELANGTGNRPSVHFAQLRSGRPRQ